MCPPERFRLAPLPPVKAVEGFGTVSLLIAAGKSPKYIALQAGHASAGFTLDRYGHLFETVRPMPVEWWDDLLWPGGYCVDAQLEARADAAVAAGEPGVPV